MKLKIETVDDILTALPEIGSEVKIINRDYTSFKKGNSYKLIGYLNDDPNRLILEGGTPGGWVSTSDIQRSANYEGLRFKTHSELIQDFGFSFLALFNLPSSFLNLAGTFIDKDTKISTKDNISNVFMPRILNVSFSVLCLTRESIKILKKLSLILLNPSSRFIGGTTSYLKAINRITSASLDTNKIGNIIAEITDLNVIALMSYHALRENGNNLIPTELVNNLNVGLNKLAFDDIRFVFEYEEKKPKKGDKKQITSITSDLDLPY